MEIKLKYPVTHENQTYSTLSMRRPKVRDQVAAKKQGGAPEDAEIHLFANLCEVPPLVIEDMDMHDYRALQEVYRGFLS